MQCPKCQSENPNNATICGHCGIVFEKYYKYHPRPGEGPIPPRARPARRRRDRPAGALRELLLPVQPEGDWTILLARGALWIVLLIWGGHLMTATIASNTVGESFLHLINLPFHEAGHVIFRPFGQYLRTLGGSLGQLLIPALCCGVLLVQTRDPFGASAALWWFGENFLDLAPYIDDARTGVLPLLGGNFGHSSPYGFHDWEYLLNEIGLLRLDHAIARGSHLLGSLIMLLALSWGALILLGYYRAAQGNSSP